MERNEDINGRTDKERDEWESEQNRREEIAALERERDEWDRCYRLGRRAARA
jgi:hypothetical protein